MTCLECGVECAEAGQVCARCGAPVAVPESVAADSAVGMVRGAAGHDAYAATADATGQASPEPYVSGRGAKVPPEIRRVLHGYSWMAWGAVFGGWALFAVGGYFANLSNSYDLRYLFASIALAVVAAFLLGRHIRWSWFLRQPRNPCSAAVAARHRGGRALMLDAPYDGVPSGLKVRLAWWAEPEMLQPGENVTYCGRRGGVGMLLVSSSAREREFVGTGRRRPTRPSGEGAVQEAPHQPGGQRSWRRHLRWGPMVLFGLSLVAAVTATLIAWVPPLTGHLGAAQLRAGECLTASNPSLDSGNPWPWFTAVRCTDPHLAEVFFAGNAWPRSLAYPGDNAISDQGLARCSTAFAAYDGSHSDQSMFSISYVQPWGDNWATGNRWLACIAYKPGTQPLSNSIKGSGH